MNPSPFHPPPVLLAVRDVHEEVRAGLGQTSLTVRTLDGVTLHVRAGELVVLRGGVASGAPSLLAALAGVRRPRSGRRQLARGVQVRRACITDDALAAIAAGWARPQTDERRGRGGRVTPVVYVFRVRARPRVVPSRVDPSRVDPSRVDPSGPMPRAVGRTTAHSSTAYSSRNAQSVDATAWQVWAESLRARGGSIVAHVSSDLVSGARRVYGARPATRRTSPAVHEATAGDRPSYASVPGSSRDSRRDNVRTITLAAGRIVSAGPASRPTWSGGSTDS